MTSQNSKEEIPSNLFFIPHTHWDREWYLPFQRFRVHLVELIDQILERFDEDPNYRHFNLDAQTVVIEDYLKVRPEMESKIKQYAETKQLGIGPWYNQPDMWTYGELLTRNLLKGSLIAKKYGGGQKIGYLPDEFGHPSQMPQLMRLADIDNYIYYHGIGDEYDEPGFCYERYWQAPDGSTVLAYLLEYGYANAKNHPITQEEFNSFVLFAQSWLPRSKSKQYFIGCGGDHYIPQKETPQLVSGFNQNEDVLEELNGGKLIFARVDEFLASVRKFEDPNDPYPTYTGEMRGSRPNMLQAGVISSRMHEKQANARCWRKLCYLGEPLMAWEWLDLQNKPKWKPFLDLAWEYVLKNQPHDSICGCSIDLVHQDMDHRFQNCEDIADEVSMEGMQRILMRQQKIEKWGYPIAIFIPLVHEGLQLLSFKADPTHLHYETNIVHVPGLDLTKTYSIKDSQGTNLPTIQQKINYKECQDLLEITFLYSSKGMGYEVFYLCDQTTPESKDGYGIPIEDAAPSFENSWLKLSFNTNGTFNVIYKPTGVRYGNLGFFEDQADGGDGYDFYAVPGDPVLTSLAAKAKISGVSHALGATFIIELNMNLPEKLNKDRTKRVEKIIEQPISIRMQVWNDIPRIDFSTFIDNKCQDHRLRAVFPTPIHTDSVYASSIYDVIERGIGIEKYAKNPDKWVQMPLPTSHVTEFVDIFEPDVAGMALINKGLPEYEARRLPNNFGIKMFQTLFRSFRYMGGDLPRRGRCGEYHPTPDAQLLKPMTFEYALYFHTKDYATDHIYTRANEFILPLAFAGGKIVIPGRSANQTDQYERYPQNLAPNHIILKCSNPNIIVTVFKQAEEGKSTILRIFNPTRDLQQAVLELDKPFDSIEIVGILEQTLNDPNLKCEKVDPQKLQIILSHKHIGTLRLNYV